MHHAAAKKRDYARAAKYLDLKRLPEDERATRGPELARHLKIVLGRKLWVDLDALSRDSGRGWLPTRSVAVTASGVSRHEAVSCPVLAGQGANPGTPEFGALRHPKRAFIPTIIPFEAYGEWRARRSVASPPAVVEVDRRQRRSSADYRARRRLPAREEHP